MVLLHHDIIASTLQTDQLLVPSKMYIQFPKNKYCLKKIDHKKD